MIWLVSFSLCDFLKKEVDFFAHEGCDHSQKRCGLSVANVGFDTMSNRKKDQEKAPENPCCPR